MNPLYDLEKASIRNFLEENQEYLRGKVLDFGCGEQPYKDLCDQETYTPVEKYEAIPENKYDVVLCTQVLEYIEQPQQLINLFAGCAPILVMTYPTMWPEVDSNDWWRFTKVGIERMLRTAEYEIIKHDERWAIETEGAKLVGGYGVIAKNNSRTNN